MSGTVVTLLVLVGGLALLAIVVRRPVGRGAEGPGSRVLVAVSRPASAQPLGELAAAVARPERGQVTPVTVLTLDVPVNRRTAAEETVQRCSSVAAENGLSADGHVRYDTSVADGLFHLAVERNASSVVVGWPRAEDGTGAVAGLEQLTSALPVPVLAARLDGYEWQRVVLQVPPEPNSDGLRASLRLATATAERVAALAGVPVVCASEGTALGGSPSQLVVVPVDPDPVAVRRAALANRAAGDVVLAMCHGARATDRRPLLPAASELYGPRPEPAPETPRPLVRTQER